MITPILRKARKFLAGESPAYHHQIMLGRIISFYHTLLLGFFYYVILTPLSVALRIFYGPFLDKDDKWKRR
ncbi:MAG TPA: hypothetical protein VJH88_01655 [Candidatus Nanoarchaeia archaeon]|nr:hypothetical protein [Candidatus Nanoarchaeia archaeon]